MEAVKAYYDGMAFVPEKPLTIPKNQTVFITIIDYTDVSAKTRRNLTMQQKRVRDAYELKLLNDNAKQLNAEALDVLQYQKDIFGEDSYTEDL
jgi:type I site-specific restriction endonuclease